MNDPKDEDWKVVVEKSPRSKRHTQEDDDLQRPESAEHVFDAPGLANPLTHGLQNPCTWSGNRANNSDTGETSEEGDINAAGQNVPEAEVRAVAQQREPDNDFAVWLEEDYDEDEEDLPYDDADAGD